MGNAANRTRAGYLPRCGWSLSRGQRSAGLLFTLLLAAASALPGAARADENGRVADSPSGKARKQFRLAVQRKPLSLDGRGPGYGPAI